MSKAFFRFLRGELNGFYVTRLNGCLNDFTENVKKVLIAFKKTQFDIETMDINTIYNIGTFAGVHLVRLSTGEAFGAMRMTEGYMVDGVERSERGLLARDTEFFEFEHTEQDSYSEDINTLATPDKRSSFIGTEEVQGYISSEDTDVIDEDGNVRPSSVLPEPPEGVAYSEFYGNKFMFLSEQTNAVSNINPILFLELYKVMQYIRYNGVNIKSFMQMVSIICPDGYVLIKSITKVNDVCAFNVTYQIDLSVDVDFPTHRIGLLEYLTNLKFPQFLLIEE